MSHHTAGLGYSKFGKDGRSDVGKRGTRYMDGPIAQQDAWHEGVIHAVIATPRIRVVLEYVGRKIAEDGLPSGAITAVIAHNQIGALMRVRTLIDFAGQIDARDGLKIILWIAH